MTGKESEGEVRNRLWGLTGGVEPASGATAGGGEEEGRGEEEGAAKPGKPDWAASVLSMPPEERFLGAAALLAVFAFFFARGWALIFHFGETGGWLVTFTLAGAAGALLLLSARVFRLPWPQAPLRERALLAMALLPACGLLIELLGNIWMALLLAGGLGMLRGAYRFNKRDSIFKW